MNDQFSMPVHSGDTKPRGLVHAKSSESKFLAFIGAHEFFTVEVFEFVYLFIIFMYFLNFSSD